MSVFHPKTSQSLREDLATNVRFHRTNKTAKLYGFISQERCALEAGIDRTMMSKIERAKTNPSLETLLKFANYLNVGVADLLIDPSKSNKGRKT
jgi:DNA-binding XRE family transcriptional regulator